VESSSTINAYTTQDIKLQDLSDDPNVETDFDFNNDGDPDDKTLVWITKPASLSGQSWLDENNDGFCQKIESNIEGIQVNLFGCDGNFVEKTQTDALGNYQFDLILPTNQYKLLFEFPTGSKEMKWLDFKADPATNFVDTLGWTNCIYLRPGEEKQGVNAGSYYQMGVVAGNPGFDESNNQQNYFVENGSYDNKNNSTQIKLYPNPCDDHVQIEWNPNHQTDWEISVFDSFGKRIDLITPDILYKANRAMFQFENINLTSGIYFIHIKNEKNHFIEKLTVQK
jgi:hypothetical protein